MRRQNLFDFLNSIRRVGLLLVLGMLTVSGAAQAERRLALVIGNADYSMGPLANPVRDARLIAASLEDVGFEVTLLENLDYFPFGRAVSDFGAKLGAAGDDAVGLF
jgi:hypothetical protein